MRTDGIRQNYITRGAGQTQQAGKSARRIIGREKSTQESFADGFTHIGEELSPYTDYDARGNYIMEGARVLPDRYYRGEIAGNVYYKGGTVSYIGLLEEAVVNGAVQLDETKSMWDNVHNAERVLIEDRAKPLYPWSSTLYSEDGQYRFRVENGKITGSTRAFYEDANGRRITAQYIAEQLASGVLPADIDGDWSFLAHLDGELYDKAMLIGRAARQFRNLDLKYKENSISEDKYLEDIHLYLLYFLGRDEGKRSATQLRVMMTDPEFGRKALTGRLVRPAPSAPYRRQIQQTPAADQTWIKPRTRRLVGQDP